MECDLHSSTVPKYNVDAVVHYLSISTFCECILLLHYILEEDTVLLLYYLYLITLFLRSYVDYMQYQSQSCVFLNYFIIIFLLYFFGSQIKNKEFDLKKRTQKNVICQVDNGLTHSIQYIKYILENISIYSLLVLVLLILKILGINYITFWGLWRISYLLPVIIFKHAGLNQDFGLRKTNTKK